MEFSCFVLLSLLTIGSFCANIPENKNQNIENNGENFFGIGKKWVVLVAGSDGWNNYRHQADICHAYQIARANGIPEENIITMMADDIAFNNRNPTPGTIINWPNGTDVYDGVVIDYSGSEVTPENFLNVIMGNKDLLTDIGTGKVVEGGPFDKVFINFVDHGSTGLLGFPEEVLWADQLNDALAIMYEKRSYSKLLMYIEACESGSMFDGILREDTNVFAVTASGPRESSWACYCGYQSGEYHTCLGDVFSVRWMEDLDATLDEAFLKKQTVFKNFANVRHMVTRSNVMDYGDFSVGSSKLSSFLGYRKSEPTTHRPEMTVPTEEKILMRIQNVNANEMKYNLAGHKMTSEQRKEMNMKMGENNKILIPSLDVNANEMKYNLARNKMSSEERKELNMKIQENNKMKSIINNVFYGIYLSVMMEKPEIQEQVGEFDQPKDLRLSLDVFPCYRSIVNKISESCFSVARNRYSFNRLKIIANLCTVDKQINKIVENIVIKSCMGMIPKAINNVY